MFKRFCGALDALQMLLEHCMPLHRTESLPASQSAGRVLSEDILSPVSLPAFDRAAMDGYAVRSADTAGGRPHAPVFIEDFLPARTGQPVPPPYDAVLMLEDAELRGRTLQSTAQLHAGKNVSREGEDIAAGERVFSAGHCLRIPDAALLMALGVEEAAVWQRPKVTVIPTGGELVEAGTRPLSPGEAYEINGLMTELYLKKWGASTKREDIVPDDPKRIREAIASNQDADMIIMIGGTSVGEKDYAPRIHE